MTRILYLGSEVPSNRKLLAEAGVTHFGWSYMRARKRGFPKTKRYAFGDYYAEDAVVVVHPGTSEVDPGEAESIAADYQDFVVDHLDEIDAFVEFDCPALGDRWREQQRAFWEEVGDKFWPVLREDDAAGDLMRLAQRYHEVAIPGSLVDADTSLAARTRALSSQYDTVWHGLAVASPENLRQVPFATASTLSWASPKMRGETIVWDGSRLVRYPKGMKDQARSRYTAVVERAGLDYAAVIRDDAKEITRLAIWSYQQLEQSMDRKRPGNPFVVIGPDDVVDHSELTDADLVAPEPEVVDNRLEPGRNAGRAHPAPREAHERAYLPVMGVETRTVVEPGEDGRDVLRDVPVLTSMSESLRQCDTCFVAVNCPAMKPQSLCAFSLPVEIRTRDQLKALLQAIIEMQGARVAFGRFTEELNGGYPDPNVSQEIDRLFKIVGQLKELETERNFDRITIERQGSAGVLSAIFGDRAQVLRELPQPVDEPVVSQIIKGALED